MDKSECKEFIYKPNKKIKHEEVNFPETKSFVVKYDSPKPKEPKKEENELIIKSCCPYCPFEARKTTLSTHIIEKHTLWYKCSQCESPTHDHTCDQKVKWYACPHCPFNTKARDSLQNHLVVKHTLEEDIQWFQCGLCEYRGKCRQSLIYHFKMRHVDKLEVFQCTECEYSSRIKRNLVLHVKSRHIVREVKWVQCCKCSYRTKRKYYLKLHMMSKHPLCISS